MRLRSLKLVFKITSAVKTLLALFLEVLLILLIMLNEESGMSQSDLSFAQSCKWF